MPDIALENLVKKKVRIGIMEYLLEKGKACNRELAKEFVMASDQAIGFEVSVLRRCGLIETSKEGRETMNRPAKDAQEVLERAKKKIKNSEVVKR